MSYKVEANLTAIAAAVVNAAIEDGCNYRLQVTVRASDANVMLTLHEDDVQGEDGIVMGADGPLLVAGSGMVDACNRFAPLLAEWLNS